MVFPGSEKCKESDTQSLRARRGEKRGAWVAAYLTGLGRQWPLSPLPRPIRPATPCAGDGRQRGRMGPLRRAPYAAAIGVSDSLVV